MLLTEIYSDTQAGHQMKFQTTSITTNTNTTILSLQEAIENTIGSVKPTKKANKPKPKAPRPVLGQLMCDKIYLENLLKNPDLAIADKKNDVVTKQAEEALRFLENREEFWRQQQTSTGH